MNDKILEVTDLSVSFTLRGKTLNAVREASFCLHKGETLAIVGESGSGKSVLTKTLIGMTDQNGKVTGGTIRFEDEILTDYRSMKDWLKIRGKRIAMVFQDPMTALNPLLKVGDQIAEMMLLHTNVSKKEAKEKAIALMEQVGIREAKRRYNQYPHEFSGGMRQRMVIATAVAAKPEILICDEPTTALDVTLQAQILTLLKEIQEKYHLSIIFITHDLGVVAEIADRVCVMYAGELVETGTCEEIFYHAVHPYTKALLRSLPQLGVKGQPLPAIKGTPPNLFSEIKGDAFASRNEDAMKIDFLLPPPLYQISTTHSVKTWLLHPYAKDNLTFNKKVKSKDIITTQKDEKKEILVSVKNLSVCYGEGRHRSEIIHDVSFDIYKGETFCLVGESGSGKTTIGRALMRILPVSAGSIQYENRVVSGPMSAAEKREYRQKVQMIFQDPMASLNERAKVDYIVSEGLYNYHLFSSEEERRKKVTNVLNKVGLRAEYATRFPHEFSGGQRQRLGIARALIMNPSFVIADEPISALDVSIRAQVINLLNDLKKERDLTYLFIAHDLSVVRFISDRIAVIYQGRIVELAPSEELFLHPLHPYTKSLLSAVLLPDPFANKQKERIHYEKRPEYFLNPEVKMREVSPGHFVLGTGEGDAV